MVAKLVEAARAKLFSPRTARIERFENYPFMTDDHKSSFMFAKYYLFLWNYLVIVLLESSASKIILLWRMITRAHLWLPCLLLLSIICSSEIMLFVFISQRQISKMFKRPYKVPVDRKAWGSIYLHRPFFLHALYRPSIYDKILELISSISINLYHLFISFIYIIYLYYLYPSLFSLILFSSY